MTRYLFRVQYVYSDDTVSYESVGVLATDADAARADVAAATTRYKTAMGATSVVTLLASSPEP